LCLVGCARALAPSVHVAEPPRVATTPAPVAAPADEVEDAPPPKTCTYTARGSTTRFELVTPCAKAVSDDAACAAAKLAVRDTTGNELQRLDLASVCLVLADDDTLIQGATALYDAQSTIVTGDFDFDGREDFAVQVGADGPYGGPTFDVYLQTANGKFARSEPLSTLTRETLGFFQIDAAHKRLVTAAKSGCCWHQTEFLTIEKGAPKPVERFIEDATGDVVVETHEVLVGKTWRTTVTRHK
jgi:hypothetical protein